MRESNESFEQLASSTTSRSVARQEQRRKEKSQYNISIIPIRVLSNIFIHKDETLATYYKTQYHTKNHWIQQKCCSSFHLDTLSIYDIRNIIQA